MNGNNLAFINNPKLYLETHTMVCYGTKATPQKEDINRMDGNTLPVTQEFSRIVDFDIVPSKLGYFDLVLMGVSGSYAGTSRHGRPIAGNYIPYLGQTSVESNARFGKINLSRVTTNYVFTFSFTGCNFVITKSGGETWAYHEPTADEWTGTDAARYPGETFVSRIGPPYDATHNGGFACLVRDQMTRNRWHAFCQMPDGIKMTKARLYETVITI